MCGIFAYIGNEKAGQTILEGLKRLEYRGYDSWGVAIKTENDVYIEKHVGTIGEAHLPAMKSSIGIGHTRWATHGGVTEVNAHPHATSDKGVIVVHNGIVENHQELKNTLQKAGYEFRSQTDSESIPFLIDHIRKTERKSTKEAVLRAFQMLHGMNAIIVYFPAEEQFFAIKNGSPLVVGIGEEECMIASDATAVIPHTKQVIFLEDDQLLEMSRKNIHLFDITGAKLSPKIQNLPYSAESAELGDFPHFMVKEIAEQPLVLRNLIENNDDQIIAIAEKIKAAYGTYLIGCGTAYYACLASTYLFSKIAKRHINAAVGSEFNYSLDFITDQSVVMALSQSGETIDIIASLKKVQEKQATIVALTNALGSTLFRMADEKLLLNAGPEKSVCATKSFTAKIAYMYLLAHQLNGTLSHGKKSLRQAVEAVEILLKKQEMIRSLAKELSAHNHIFILGRGVSYPTALESALKIKEVSYLHAEGFAGGELKHGVIALIEKGTPVLIYNPEDETYEDTLSSAYEVKARGAYVIGVSSKPAEVYDSFIDIESYDEASVIPFVVVSQLLGYYIAVEKGLDPDKPRNLAKSVTVK